jgi:hypothetical protein
MNIKFPIQVFLFLIFYPCFTYSQFEGTMIITENRYPGCVELSNNTARVVLEPNLGGRVLKFELNGKNVLFENPIYDGKVYEPGVYIHPPAGRFDIGPENTIPSHPILYLGKWMAVITGNRQAEMISQKDSATGVQLVRRFRLADNGAILECAQVIRNVSNVSKSWCHWSRTFVKGGGISLTPLSANSRYPKSYLTFGPGDIINYYPEQDENARVREGILEISGSVRNPKFMTDGTAGWLAYITKDNQLFFKTYPVFRDRIYGEIAAGTASVYYFREERCEIEPIGPMENIEPGHEVSFTEKWYLFDYSYPKDKQTNLAELLNIINPYLEK